MAQSLQKTLIRRLRISNRLCVALSLFSLGGSIFCWWRGTRPVEQFISVVEKQPIPDEIAEIVTNLPAIVARVSARSVRTNNVEVSNTALSPSVEVAPARISKYVRYHYFEIGGETGAMLYGRPVRVGSLTSVGKVLEIFPDVIHCDGGEIYNNNGGEVSPPQLVKE